MSVHGDWPLYAPLEGEDRWLYEMVAASNLAGDCPNLCCEGCTCKLGECLCADNCSCTDEGDD